MNSPPSAANLDFNSLSVTTMTLVAELECSLSIDELFILLPITRVDVPVSKARTRCKIPHAAPGSIVSMRYRNLSRGIIRSSSSNFFKNSITLDLSLSAKNVNMKVSRSKLQMCGAKSLEQGSEGVQLLLAHVAKLENIFKRLRENPRKREACHERITKYCKIQKQWNYSVPSSPPAFHTFLLQNLACKDLPERLRKAYPDLDLSTWISTHLSEKERVDLDPAFFTEALGEEDPEYLELCIRDIEDYSNIEKYFDRLEWLKNISTIATGPLECREITKAMVNFNYSLGYPIDRFSLSRCFDGVNGFNSHFQNSMEHYVTIELPYERRDTKKRKEKKPCHSFLVYQSGLITQSGPNETQMKHAFHEFIRTLLSFENQIRKKNAPNLSDFSSSSSNSASPNRN